MPQLFQDDPGSERARVWNRSSWRAPGPGIVALPFAIVIPSTLDAFPAAALLQGA